MTDENKYHKQRALVLAVSALVAGKSVQEATDICEAAGLKHRWIKVDGESCLLTCDCRSDRIGFIVNDGVVTETMNG